MTAPEGYVLAFGIPWAREEFVGRRFYAICPRCGLRIEQVERKDFESHTGREYAEHYDAEHAVADGRILVDGEWYEKR